MSKMTIKMALFTLTIIFTMIGKCMIFIFTIASLMHLINVLKLEVNTWFLGIFFISGLIWVLREPIDILLTHESDTKKQKGGKSK